MANRLTITGFLIVFSLLYTSGTLAQTALQDLRQNGILRVGIRKDAAPFGYLEGNNWKGLCIESAELLRANLEQKLNRAIQLEKIETNLNEASGNGRFQSVASKRAHLECGPNTILKHPPQGITYSLPFLYSGTYLFVKPENKLRVNPSGFLQDVIIGVLGGSLTQQFVAGRYQLAQQQIYQGQSGRQRAVKDAIEGKIDAFASDGMLLLGEALRQGLNQTQYAIIPDRPLTCISYGMILPANDPEWVETVNNFIRDRRATELMERTFGPNSPFLPMSVIDQDKCI